MESWRATKWLAAAVLGALAASLVLAQVQRGSIYGTVVDNTGVTTRYKVSLKWTPGPGESGYNANAEPGPSIYAVLQDAGFRVEPMKVPQEFIVIDSAEKPDAGLERNRD